MLNRCIKLLFILIWPLAVSADHVHWSGEYDKAFQQAYSNNKVLLVLVVKEDCHLCNDIIKTVFMNHSYIEQINRDMLSVIVTYEGRQSYPIEMYYTRVFPTLFIVDSQRELFLSKPLYGKDINIKNIEKILKSL